MLRDQGKGGASDGLYDAHSLANTLGETGFARSRVLPPDRVYTCPEQDLPAVLQSDGSGRGCG